MDNESIITFNVGGKIYSVKQSLLNRYPETMLGITSSLWNNNEHNNNEPIFIDRNGDRFSYIIDYMRDQQKIMLPFSITKESIVKDLEFYGFDDIIIDDITECIDPKINDVVSTMQRMESAQCDQHKILCKLLVAQEELVKERVCFKNELSTNINNLNEKVRFIWLKTKQKILHMT